MRDIRYLVECVTSTFTGFPASHSISLLPHSRQSGLQVRQVRSSAGLHGVLSRPITDRTGTDRVD